MFVNFDVGLTVKHAEIMSITYIIFNQILISEKRTLCHCSFNAVSKSSLTIYMQINLFISRIFYSFIIQTIILRLVKTGNLHIPT